MALSDRMLVGVLGETVYGESVLTGSTLPSTYLAVEACSITPDVAIIESQDITNSYSGRKHETMGIACDVSMTFKLTPRMSGSAPQAPHWDPLLRASGFDRVTVDDTVDFYRYHPSTSNNMTDTPSAAIVVYHIDDSDTTKSRKMLARGARGNLNMTFQLEDFARASFEGRGLYFEWPATETTVPAPGVGPVAGFSGELPGMTTKDMTITVASQTVCITGMELNTNWAVGEDKCLNSDGSVNEVYLHRGPSERMGGTMTLKGRSATLNTLLPYIAAGTEFQVSVTLTSDAGDMILTMPKQQFGNYTMSADGGRMQFDIPYFLNGNWDNSTQAGDNELTIDFGDGAT